MSGIVEKLKRGVEDTSTVQVEGRVITARGTVVRATLPGARIGDRADIHLGDSVLTTDVAGFDRDEALLLPLGSLHGVYAGARVVLQSSARRIVVGDALFGRMVDALGRPRDGGPPIDGERVSLRARAPDPLDRRTVNSPVKTGIRVLDGLVTLGHGQRVGIFSEAGAGKSSLVFELVASKAFDVAVVALVGERGREVRHFMSQLEARPEVQSRTVVVAATSDQPAQLRVCCPQVATAIAEHFRKKGKQVLLCVDSLTRVARAIREAGLAAGEAPVREGYPPSLFAELPALVERAGRTTEGSITAVYTVLTESARRDVLAEEVKGLLDGHLHLSRELAARGHFPAVDVLRSMSRLMPAICEPGHLAAARRLRELLSALDSRRDLLAIGAYERGSEPLVDEALSIRDEIHDFLRQDRGDVTQFEDMVERLRTLADA